MGTPFLSVRLITHERSPPNIRFHCPHKYLPVSLVGGCIFSVASFVPIRWCRFLIGAAILLFLALVAAFYFFVPRQSHYQVNNALICAEGAAFAAAGLGVLALALIDLWRKRDADSLHLCLWVIGTFLFSIFFN